MIKPPYRRIWKAYPGRSLAILSNKLNRLLCIFYKAPSNAVCLHKTSRIFFRRFHWFTLGVFHRFFPLLRFPHSTNSLAVIFSAVATPTAVPDRGQPTSLSSPLVLLFLALLAPYLPAHISDTTNTILL